MVGQNIKKKYLICFGSYLRQLYITVKYGSYLNLYKYFLHFQLLILKKLNREKYIKYKNLVKIYLAKFLSKSLAHVKTSRSYTGAPGNV